MLSDPFWLNFRLIIVSLFLGLVGFSLQLTTARRIRIRPYLKRLGLVAGSAALISLGTWLMYGDKMILFGVLHFIALASVLGLRLCATLPLVRRGADRYLSRAFDRGARLVEKEGGRSPSANTPDGSGRPP